MLRRLACLLLACGLPSCGSDDSDDACTGAAPCEAAVIHLSRKVGIPVGVDFVVVGVCHDQTCIDADVAVPEIEITHEGGTDPALVVKITRTEDLFADDLQGVFAFEVTWTSPSVQIADGDYVSVSVTSFDDDSNISTVGTTVEEAEDATCGCFRVEVGG